MRTTPATPTDRASGRAGSARSTPRSSTPAWTRRPYAGFSRSWALPTWSKPATPCLASRIRYGVEVTPHRLARVDRAEVAVRALLANVGLNVSDLRVRDLGDAVRVEVDASIVDRVTQLPEMARALADAGFAELPYVVEAFRSGRLNSEM